MHPALFRAGAAEVRLAENAAFWLEQGVLAAIVCQLAIRRLRPLLCRGLAIVDVHPQKFPIQHGLSHDQPQLRHRHVFGHPVFP